MSCVPRTRERTQGEAVAIPRQFRGDGAAEGGIDIMMKLLTIEPTE
jgi:hypothetical protein